MPANVGNKQRLLTNLLKYFKGNNYLVIKQILKIMFSKILKLQ